MENWKVIQNMCVMHTQGLEGHAPRQSLRECSRRRGVRRLAVLRHRRGQQSEARPSGGLVLSCKTE